MVLGAVLCAGSLLGLTFRLVVGGGGAETGGREQGDERKVQTKILDVTIFRSPAVNVLYAADFLNRFIGMLYFKVVIIKINSEEYFTVNELINETI